MGLFGRKAQVAQTVGLDEAKAWLGQTGHETLREIADSFTFSAIDLPDPPDKNYYVGELVLRNGKIAAHVAGMDRGFMDTRQLPYAVPVFKRSSGQPVRCVISRVSNGWRAYAR